MPPFRRLAPPLLAAALAVPVAAQPVDSLARPAPVRAAPGPRPTWGEAWLATGAMGLGMMAGGAAGMALEHALVRPDCGCLTGLMGGFAGGTLGAGAGALLTRRVVGQRRGSVIGATAGFGAGLFAGAVVPIDHEGRANAVLMPVLAATGGALGYRYGLWARQRPARRTRVAVVPVAAPRGAGVYAAVAF